MVVELNKIGKWKNMPPSTGRLSQGQICSSECFPIDLMTKPSQSQESGFYFWIPQVPLVTIWTWHVFGNTVLSNVLSYPEAYFLKCLFYGPGSPNLDSYSTLTPDNENWVPQSRRSWSGQSSCSVALCVVQAYGTPKRLRQALLVQWTYTHHHTHIYLNITSRHLACLSWAPHSPGNTGPYFTGTMTNLYGEIWLMWEVIDYVVPFPWS